MAILAKELLSLIENRLQHPAAAHDLNTPPPVKLVGEVLSFFPLPLPVKRRRKTNPKSPTTRRGKLME